MNRINLLLFFLFFIFYTNVFAQQFTARSSATKVPLGEPFEVTFSLNGNGSKFTPPNFSEFQVLGGPNQSSSMSFVNGQMSQSISYSYYLTPKKEGNLTIGAATITIDGKVVQTSPIKIEATKADPAAAKKRQEQQQAQQRRQQQIFDPFGMLEEDPQPKKPSKQDIGNIKDNVFMRVALDKSKVYVGEQIVATFKIYTRVNIVGIQADDMPKLNGFWQEDIKIENAKQYNESVDGIQYTVAEVKKTILFPQRAGNLVIEPLKVQAVVRQQVRGGNSIFDQVFGGRAQDVQVKLESPQVKVQVTALPEPKPDNFSGISGKLSLKAVITKNKVKTNDATNIKITVTGKGNISLLDAPKLAIPEDIESYDPKSADNISKGASGVAGSRSFDYLLIPRTAGNFTIPSTTLSYFDTETRKYNTLTIPSFDIEVEKGAGETGNTIINSSANKQDIKVIGNDIRYIKKDVPLKLTGSTFYRSPLFYGLVGLIFFSGIGMFAFTNYQKRLNSDVVLVKQRGATKIAQKRLAQAQKHLDTNQLAEFYLEVHRALHGYISDKYVIPVSELSKENIETTLTAKKVNSNQTKQLVKLIADCEMARYAPSAVIPMQEMYNEAIDVIKNLEA